MPRRKKEDAAATRQAMLEVARDMFSEKGIEQTSLKAISAQAGVTHGALYWHFKNRQDMVQAVYAEFPLHLDHIYLNQLQSARQDPLGALKGFLVEWVLHVCNEPKAKALWKIFYLNGSRHCPEVEALEPQLLEEQQVWLGWLKKLVKKARKQKLIPAKPKDGDDPVAHQLMVVAFEAIHSRLNYPHLMPSNKLTGVLVENYINGLHAQGAVR